MTTARRFRQGGSLAGYRLPAPPTPTPSAPAPTPAPTPAPATPAPTAPTPDARPIKAAVVVAWGIVAIAIGGRVAIAPTSVAPSRGRTRSPSDSKHRPSCQQSDKNQFAHMRPPFARFRLASECHLGDAPKLGQNPETHAAFCGLEPAVGGSKRSTRAATGSALAPSRARSLP